MNKKTKTAVIAIARGAFHRMPAYGRMTGTLQLSAPPARSRLEALATFRQAARMIWQNADAVPVSVSEEEPETPQALAAVHSVRARACALTRRILNPEAPRVLRVSARALALEDEPFWRLMVHEAIHIGVSPHGATFRRLCKESGGAMTGAEARREPVRVQRKEGGRFRDVRTFERACLQEAKAWGLEQVRLTGKSHRLVY